MVLLIAGLVVAACGGDDSEEVVVSGAWARSSPMMAEAGAAYFQITSDVDDVLIGASVDPSVAGVVEIHESRMVDMADGEMDNTDEMADGEMADMGGVMEMVEVGRIALPAGESVSLEPGGLHLMLLDLPEPLSSGDSFDITLDFENGPDLVVTAEIRDNAPE